MKDKFIKHKKFLIFFFIIIDIITIGAAFPIINKDVTYSMLFVMLVFCWSNARLFKNLYKNKYTSLILLLFMIAITILGMTLRYFLEYGEVSNLKFENKFYVLSHFIFFPLITFIIFLVGEKILDIKNRRQH